MARIAVQLVLPGAEGAVDQIRIAAGDAEKTGVPGGLGEGHGGLDQMTRAV